MLQMSTPNLSGKHLSTGDFAPSNRVASPTTNLKDWSTTEDNLCEPETQELEHPEALKASDETESRNRQSKYN